MYLLRWRTKKYPKVVEHLRDLVSKICPLHSHIIAIILLHVLTELDPL